MTRFNPDRGFRYSAEGVEHADGCITDSASVLLRRPTVAPVIVSAGNQEQFMQDIGAVGWQLTKSGGGLQRAGRALTGRG
jgi:hypothetical protein